MITEGDIVKHKKTGIIGEVTVVEFNRVWVALENGREQKFMEWELELIQKVRL